MSGALVLDSEGLAKAVQRDREVHEWLTAARDADLPVVTSAAVLVEVIHPRINDAALKWTLSRLRVEPVTQALAQSAATLLRTAGLHGHKYAIDAMLCATAPTHHGRVTILTSDVEDIALLTADHSRIATEKV
ncbi:type II toxin-antitoxin system VapC family toxin [Streptomyces sp. NPDC029674]|uniref:type II toxin-antitoxin system VapC family toxin n=1 Tax=Streptomyces sp. NPDC029674 TaxID=3365297 RepID=UPI00384E56C3